MRLKFIDILRGSYNLNFLLQEVDGGEKWVAKISKRLSDFNLDYRNLDDRAILASRLAKLAEVNVPESKYISEKEIIDSVEKENLLRIAKENGYLYNEHKVLISKYMGLSLPQFLCERGREEIANLDDLVRNLVFDLWVGNYDKKDADYVVSDSGVGYSIDYSLCGLSGLDAKSSIGFGALSFSIDEVADVSFAIGRTLRDIVVNNKYAIEFFDSTILKIESISDEKISNAFEGLSCLRIQSHENINDLFIDYLLKRKKIVREAIATWCSKGYPERSQKINYSVDAKRKSLKEMPKIIASTTLQQSINHTSTMIGNQLMLFAIESDEYFKLDEIGMEIWDMLEQPKTFDEVVKALAQKFDAEESVIVDETKEFIQALFYRNLLILI